MNRVCFSFITVFILTYHSLQHTCEKFNLSVLSNDFFTLQLSSQKDSPSYLIETTTTFSKEPIICIIVAEPYEKKSVTDNKNLLPSLYAFSQKLTIPTHFFTSNEPSHTINPNVLFFNWCDKENNKRQKVGGELLAQGITRIAHRFPSAHIVLIGYGFGNRVINYATHALKPIKNKKKDFIDLVIQLAPPVVKDLYPNTQVTKKTIAFYTQKELFLQSKQKYEKYYAHHHYPLIMNIMLLINNKHPQQQDMLSCIVAKNLFQLCSALQGSCPFYVITHMQKQGIVLHHRAHLSNIRPETHLKLVAVPIEPINPELLQKTLNAIDKETLLHKCVRLMEHDEQEHQSLWGSYPLGKLSQTKSSLKKHKHTA